MRNGDSHGRIQALLEAGRTSRTKWGLFRPATHYLELPGVFVARPIHKLNKFLELELLNVDIIDHDDTVAGLNAHRSGVSD